MLKEFRLKMLRKLKEIALNTLTKVLNGIKYTEILLDIVDIFKE